MPSVALCYLSQHGQTARIVDYLAVQFGNLGWRPQLFNLAVHAGPSTLGTFDAVVVAAPLYVLHYPGPVARFARRHRAALSRHPATAFVSVSLSAASEPDAALGPVAQFLDAVAWAPRWIASLPGALNYTAYSPLMRAIMRWISASHGGPVDTSRDYQMTRWNEVALLARTITSGIGGAFDGTRLALPGRTLDGLMPEFEHRLVQRVRVDADWDAVMRAMESLTPSDMPMASLLARIRTPWSEAGGDVRFGEAADRFGVVRIPSPPGERVGGLIGRFWKPGFDVRRFSDHEAFLAFDDRRYTRVLTSFSLERHGDGSRWLRTETRIHSLGAGARIRFRVYWLCLGLGIRLYMRSVLAGVCRVLQRRLTVHRR